MAEQTIITIQQTLHGYKDGHSLLASSVDLTSLERRELQLLSDYSGTGVETGFTEYLTGYSLPKSRFYALAKTWYAEEMRRPGSVWTQTLLIDVSFLWMIQDIKVLLQYFIRPSNSDFENYSTELSYKVTSAFGLKPKLNNQFYDLSGFLYSSEKPLVILSNDAKKFQETVLDIWTFQWPKLKRNFSFCTGAVSLRLSRDQYLDLQILPFARERFLTRTERDNVLLIDLEKQNISSKFIELFKSYDISNIYNFMVKFGADVTADKSNFLRLFNIYSTLNHTTRNSNLSLLSYVAESFPLANEGLQIKQELVKNAFKSTLNQFSVIEFLLTNDSYASLNLNYSSLIENIIDSKTISKKEIYDFLIFLKRHSLNEYLLNILQSQPLSAWILHTEDFIFLLANLISAKPQLLSSKIIWTSAPNIQELWLNAAIESKSISIQKLITTLLDNEIDIHIELINQYFGNKIFSPIYFWIQQNNRTVSQNWQFFIIQNFIDAFASLSDYPNYNVFHLNLITNLSPTSSQWRKVSFGSIQKVLDKVSQMPDDRFISGIFTYFITVSFTNSVKEPIKLAEATFQPLHDLLGKQFFEPYYWERFQRELGRNIYDLVELDFFSKIFKERKDVPDWDRCEFLRRTLISSILMNEWPLLSLFAIVSDKETFECIVDFCIEVKPLRKMLKGILKDQNIISNSFHMKVLQKKLS